MARKMEANPSDIITSDMLENKHAMNHAVQKYLSSYKTETIKKKETADVAVEGLKTNRRKLKAKILLLDAKEAKYGFFNVMMRKDLAERLEKVEEELSLALKDEHLQRFGGDGKNLERTMLHIDEQRSKFQTTLRSKVQVYKVVHLY